MILLHSCNFFVLVWYFSLLIPYEQFCIQPHYHHKELIPEKYTTENNSMYQLIFDTHITLSPAIHTDQYSDTTNS